MLGSASMFTEYGLPFLPSQWITASARSIPSIVSTWICLSQIDADVMNQRAKFYCHRTYGPTCQDFMQKES